MSYFGTAIFLFFTIPLDTIDLNPYKIQKKLDYRSGIVKFKTAVFPNLLS